MIVKNNEASKHRIALPAKTKSVSEPVRYFDLMPGANVVAKADWEQVKGHPVVQFRVKEETYEVDEDADGDIHKIADEHSAIRLVEETLDRTLLKRWLDADPRANVQVALLKQLERVKPDKKEEKKDEGK